MASTSMPGDEAGRIKPPGALGPIDTGWNPVDWVEERTGAGGVASYLLYRPIPRGVNWFYTLGATTLTVFMLQAITGIILAMYYSPSPETAWESIRAVNDEPFTLFVRSMHRWGASIMIIVLVLHMCRVYFTNSYKYPRELNWLVGMMLLILTMAMGLTGYLLIWDQKAYWATVVAVNINGTAPILGPLLADFLRGGAEFNDTTLSRFYAIHMLLIPGGLITFIFIHLYLLVRIGIAVPPWVPGKPAATGKARKAEF
jgi:quinol-cytochrome oxidoreductase complex cytochrome b subunit